MLLSPNSLRHKALNSSKMNRKHNRFDLTRGNCKRYCSQVMNSTNSLSAPGRMDVVEQVLAGARFGTVEVSRSVTVVSRSIWSRRWPVRDSMQ
jgi:hypothetical protein